MARIDQTPLASTEGAATMRPPVCGHPQTDQTRLKLFPSRSGDKINIVVMGADLKTPKAVIEVRRDGSDAGGENAAVDLVDRFGRQILPKELSETLALADYLIDVMEADSFGEFINATVGAVLHIVVSGFYHAHGFAVLLPIIGWLTDLFDQKPSNAHNSRRDHR